MTDLSPAAQAVMDAFNREAKPEPHHQREAIAAALRAAEEQLSYGLVGSAYCVVATDDLLAIAAELEGAND